MDPEPSMSMRTLAGRLEILPELVPMSPSIFETIALVIAPELYGGKPFAEPTDAAPGSIEKLEIMIQRVQDGYSAISPGDKKDRHASHYNDRGADHRCWLDTMEFNDE